MGRECRDDYDDSDDLTEPKRKKEEVSGFFQEGGRG